NSVKVLIYCTLSSLGDSSNCTSPEAVNIVRKQIVKNIDLWLSQCHEPTRTW
uniref:Uncharacterized protein n=1 Tax=Aegilops tauschii subsp. strangulata TaxID=200361 RepID=A0A452YLP2_AEGTS